MKESLEIPQVIQQVVGATRRTFHDRQQADYVSACALVGELEPHIHALKCCIVKRVFTSIRFRILGPFVRLTLIFEVAVRLCAVSMRRLRWCGQILPC